MTSMAGVPKKTVKWRCEVCTIENLKNENVCEICNNIKGAKSDVQAKQNEFYPKYNVQMSQKKHDKPQDKNNDGKCFLCGQEKQEQCSYCHNKVFCSACSKRYHEHPHRTWHVNRSNDTIIPHDVKDIISHLKSEIQQQCEDAKSIIESGKAIIDQTSQYKRNLIEQIDDAKRHIEQRQNSYAESKPRKAEQSSNTRELQRKAFEAEREEQWIDKEEEFLKDFREDRESKLTQIANALKIKLQEKMEREGLPKESNLHKLSEKQIRKLNGNFRLKMEGMRVMWDAREDLERDAHRLKAKAQWDMQTNTMWATKEQDYMAKQANNDRDKVGIMVKDVTNKINHTLELCRNNIEDMILSKPLNHINEMQQAFEGRIRKVLGRCQELDNSTQFTYTTIQQLNETIKALNNEKQKTDTDLDQTRSQMKDLKQKYKKQTDDLVSKSNILKNEAEDLRSQLNTLTVDNDSNSKQLTKVKQQLKSQKQLQEDEQHEWELERQKSLKEQHRLETEIKKWQDTIAVLNSSECKLLEMQEELTKEIQDLKQENDQLRELSSQEYIKNQLEKDESEDDKGEDAADIDEEDTVEAIPTNTEVITKNDNDASVDAERESSERDSATTVQKQNDNRPEAKGFDAGIQVYSKQSQIHLKVTDEGLKEGEDSHDHRNNSTSLTTYPNNKPQNQLKVNDEERYASEALQEDTVSDGHSHESTLDPTRNSSSIQHPSRQLRDDEKEPPTSEGLRDEETPAGYSNKLTSLEPSPTAKCQSQLLRTTGNYLGFHHAEPQVVVEPPHGTTVWFNQGNYKEPPLFKRLQEDMTSAGCSYKSISPSIRPTDGQTNPNKHLPPDPIEINILVIGDYVSQDPSLPIIINALAGYVTSDNVTGIFYSPPVPLIEYQIQRSANQLNLKFSDKGLNQQEFNLHVPKLKGCKLQLIQMPHRWSWYTAEPTRPEIEEMFQIFSQKKCIHCIIVVHYPTAKQPIPTKLLSLMHKSAAKNIIFIERGSNDDASIQSQLSLETHLEFDPQVFHRYNEFRESYVPWAIAHKENDEAGLEQIKDNWHKLAFKWRNELLRRMPTEILPPDSREIMAVMKAAISVQDVLVALTYYLKDFRAKALVDSELSYKRKLMVECHSGSNIRQDYAKEITRLENDYKTRNQTIQFLLTKAVKLDNYLKENAIICDKLALKQRIKQELKTKYNKILSTDLDDFLQEFINNYPDLRFNSVEEILQLDKESKQ